MSAPVLQNPPRDKPEEGGELVGVGAPKRPSPHQGGAKANPPEPERRRQPERAEPRVRK
jgi:hypothetical protein